MVVPAYELLSRRVYSGDDHKHRPAYNAIPVSIGGSRLMATGVSYKELWARFKKCPELVATLSILVTDIMGDRPEWAESDGAKIGRNKRLKAEKFWRDNRGKETIKAFLFDALLDGDGFLWKGKFTPEERKARVKEAFTAWKEAHPEYSPVMLESKELATQFEIKAMADEDVRSTRRFDHLAASTTRILHDGWDIIGYEQIAPGGEHVVFNTEEVIHYRYMGINGEVQGFAPASALMAEIVLLWLVKGNMTSYMQNGGGPDKAFILPEEMTQSQNYRQLIETLRKYKAVENRHGSLVFTGNLKIEDLQGSPKDLEYKDLALYITSNIAFAYGIPVTRIPYLIGTSSSKGDSGGLSEAGYWNKISDMQDTIEDLLNGQLFEELGWRIKFARRYKQDEVREAQVAQMMTDTVTKMQSILAKSHVKLSQDKLLDLLDLHDEDVEALTPDEERAYASSTGLDRQNNLNTHDVMAEPDKLKRDQAKRNVANSKDVGATATNP